MLRQYELVERVKAYDPDANEDLLNRAYVFSMKAHGSQLRASGDPYFSHPIEVAGILTDLRMDDETIATAILHDTIEDTVATPEQVSKLFGPSVARLVDGVTKLSRIEAQTENERAAENLRKFLLAMSDDIRVLLVKLADRLHNMRTLRFITSPEKRRRIARETMDIYAPLAERIGMYEFMNELQTLAFAELEPDAYATIQKRLDQLRAGGGDTVRRVESGLRLLLANAGVIAEDVRGREKQAFSIWRKMEQRHVAFEQMSDVLAFRVIVPEPEDCYRALGAIHARWPMVPGRFKDFVSTPKRNGYRSLHTTVQHRERMRIEVQIRTRTMHEQAEYGLAAHWGYKHGLNGSGERYPWLNDLIEIVSHAASPEEVLESTRLAMFQDQVFCFTPRGELIQLPRGATPVDFAYAVHSKLGDGAVGAKVNGRVVPLRTRLDNGDQVEVVTSETARPDPAWERFAVTAKARAAIRRFVRQRERTEWAQIGAKLFDAVVDQLGIPVTAAMVKAALVRLKLADQSALHVALARRTISDAALAEALMPGRKATAPRRKASGPKGISIKGLTPGVGYTLAKCHPIPGDRIVGVRREGEVIEVHTLDCPSLAELEADEWLDLQWGPDNELAVARLSAVVRHEPGALAQMASVLASQGGNIVNLSMSHRDRAFHTFTIDVEVGDVAHLTNILASLRASRAVTSVERVRG